MYNNLKKYERPDIDKTYLHGKHPFKLSYQLFINGRGQVKNPKAFTDYSQKIDDVYENLEDYNPTKKMRLLIVFDDMIADMESNKKLILLFTVLFLRGKNPIFHLFLYHNLILECLDQDTIIIIRRLSATHFIVKIPNKRQTASNHLSDIDFKSFMKLYKDYTKKPYSFLLNVVYTTLSLRFRKNLL